MKPVAHIQTCQSALLKLSSSRLSTYRMQAKHFTAATNMRLKSDLILLQLVTRGALSKVLISLSVDNHHTIWLEGTAYVT